MPFWKRQGEPIDFPRLRKLLTEVSQVDWDRGIAPKWMPQVPDAVLLWALYDRTITSAPFHLAALQIEKTRRDFQRQALIPTLVGGACTLAGGLAGGAVGAAATLAAAWWSSGCH